MIAEDTTLKQYFTSDGWLKYYEYVDTLKNLLPSVRYFVNVTAFDYGSPASGLPSLETSPTVGFQTAFAQGPAPAQDDWQGKVYVYPNPYRIDAGYKTDGFEGRDQGTRTLDADRMRKVNFANLPPKCIIRIYTINGDLVREIRHDLSPADPMYTHDMWDLITRNTQQAVSGLYYWTVEDDRGRTQVGKLALIM